MQDHKPTLGGGGGGSEEPPAIQPIVTKIVFFFVTFSRTNAETEKTMPVM